MVGANQRFPSLDADGGQFLERIAEHLRPKIIEDECSGLDVPFPGSGTGSLDDARQSLALLPQLLFGDFPFGDVRRHAQITRHDALFVKHGGHG